MEYKLPDNTVIKVTSSDGYSGPDVKYGQRCGSAIWYKINNQDKFQASKHRHMHKMVEWIQLSENIADFLEGEK